MSMTAEDVKSAIKDVVPAVVAERMTALEEKWKGEDAKREKSIEEKLAAVSKAGTVAPVARGEKGLEFARVFKALCVAKMDGGGRARMIEVLKEWGTAESTIRSLQESVFDSMGSMVPDQLSSEFIDLLRAQTVVMESGARELNFKGSMSLGRQNAAATAAYIGEGANIAKSQPTTGQLQLSAKKLAALVPVSNDLIRNPSVKAEAFVRDDLLKVMALKKDLALIRGQGTEYSPKGLRYSLNSANINAQSGTALANKVADIGKMIRLVEEADVPESRRGFLMTPRTKWALALTLDSNGNFVFMDQMMRGVLFGYPYKTTTQIPNNLGGGTNESEVYFQEFSEFVVGVDTALQIEAFPNGTYHDGSAVVSGISADESVLRAIERHDCVVRRDKSGAILTGVTWTS